MIVTIRGLQEGLKNAASVTALLSAMTAIVRSKKTLMMQLTGFEEASALQMLEGKSLREQELQMTFKMYRDEGIDAIMVRAETSDLTKEHFDQTVTEVLDKQNLFDVLKETNKREFYDFLDKAKVRNILKGAKQVYDYIYVLLPEREEVIQMVQEMSDEDIVVVPQGPAVEIDYTEKPFTVIVNDFESKSIYDPRVMAKSYGVKKIYTLPHNYMYRDAIISQTLVDFVLENRKDMREDINYEFTSSVIKLLNKYITGEIDDDEEENDVEKMPKIDDFDTTDFPELKELPDESIQEVYVKKGLFGRKKKKLTADF